MTVPTVEDLRSAELVHRHGEVFSPPALTNFLGCVQTDLDLTGVRSLNFPPYAHADTVTGSLYLDGRYLPSYGEPITFVWQPDRVERSMRHGALQLTSTTVLVPETTAAIVLLTAKNTGAADREVQLGLSVRSTIGKSVEALTGWLPYHEDDNAVAVDRGRNAFVFTASRSAAVSVQGLVAVDRTAGIALSEHQRLDASATLPAGHELTVAYVHVMGENAPDVLATYDRLAADPKAVVADTEEFWNGELFGMFTPEDGRYSGALPVLETSDEGLRRLYLTGALGVVYFRRESPVSTLGRTYDTLMPRYWQTATFLWDFSLSSLVHALLDPVPMRRQLEHWMRTDIHTCMATEWVTGSPIGMWYAVNDYAMVRTSREYLRWTGDRDWLRQEVPDRTGAGRAVSGYLEEYATAWRKFASGSGLADYGSLGNLLECVSSYVHEVASLNAANVFCARTVADILDLLGDASKAAKLRDEARTLLTEVRKLYADGEGYWNARHPDAGLVPVRHCYDFATIGTLLADDLTAQQRAEMTRFFDDELRTPTWMRALSPRDPDCVFSVRPDHQWNGAYPAWPSESAIALLRMGQVDLAVDWMRGLAKTAQQGPFGQAHFDERVIEPDAGAARKAPAEAPYISDWSSSSIGSWASLVIEGVFGVSADLTGRLTATPVVDRFDPDARLVGLRCQGERYDVDRSGVTRQD